MTEPISCLHVHIEGWTASFGFPLVKSGTQISTPVPSYSNLLGMISACAGRIITPEETRIGFEYHCSQSSLEIERKDRLALKGGKLGTISKATAPKDYRFHVKTYDDGKVAFLEEMRQGIGNRQIYWYPKLDLYITNLSLRSAFENPAATPCLGRSQDIAWITSVKEIKLTPLDSGAIGPTLIPTHQTGVPGLVVRLPEWMVNNKMGYSRDTGPFGVYQAMIPTMKFRCIVGGKNLYHPSDEEEFNHAIYLHEWARK